jgi:hypothetical protein
MQKFLSRGLTSRRRKPKTTHLRLERLEERTVLASWVEGFGGTAIEDSDLSQTVDPHGNVYLSGEFRSQTADFDPGPGIANLSNAGITDAFAAKYAADGSFVWARRFGSAGVDRAYASAFASEGTGEYLYVTGHFEGSVDFGAGTLTSAGGKDLFMAKLDAATGATVWAKRIGAKGDEVVSDIAVADSRVYVTGDFYTTVDFDPGSGTALLTPAGKGKNLRRDAFVLTLDSSGGFVSAWKIGGTETDHGLTLVADGTSLYLLGHVSTTVDLDPGPAVQNASGRFIARYSASPSPSWVRSFQVQTYGDGLSLGGGLSIDADSLYFTGSFGGTIDFDPGPGTANLTSVGSDVAVAKYSKTDGSLVWAKQFGGLENDYAGTSIVDEATGMLYIGGNYYSDEIDFNPSGPGGEMISEGWADGFLLKLDAASGDYQQVWRMGGTGGDKARVIGIVGTTVYVAGNFEATANFPTGGTLTSAGETDIFLMAFDESAPLSSVTSSSSSSGSTAEEFDLAQLALAEEWSVTSTSRKAKKR